jgi:hypothetical protein
MRALQETVDWVGQCFSLRDTHPHGRPVPTAGWERGALLAYSLQLSSQVRRGQGAGRESDQIRRGWGWLQGETES